MDDKPTIIFIKRLFHPLLVSLRQLLHPQFGYLNYFLSEWIGIANPPAWLADKEWVIPTLAVAAV